MLVWSPPLLRDRQCRVVRKTVGEDSPGTSQSTESTVAGSFGSSRGASSIAGIHRVPPALSHRRSLLEIMPVSFMRSGTPRRRCRFSLGTIARLPTFNALFHTNRVSDFEIHFRVLHRNRHKKQSSDSRCARRTRRFRGLHGLSITRFNHAVQVHGIRLASSISFSRLRHFLRLLKVA